MYTTMIAQQFFQWIDQFKKYMKGDRGVVNAYEYIYILWRNIHKKIQPYHPKLIPYWLTFLILHKSTHVVF